jgi:hypothetical protein
MHAVTSNSQTYWEDEASISQTIRDLEKTPSLVPISNGGLRVAENPNKERRQVIAWKLPPSTSPQPQLLHCYFMEIGTSQIL